MGEDKKNKSELESEFKTKNIDNISKIIATICPDYYASSKTRAKVKKLKKEDRFWEAVDAVEIKAPESGEKFQLSYNSSQESLEPVYFWILDFPVMAGAEKLIDNFVSSPGSGHFSELMGKATRMQEEAMKMMQTVGVLIKSVIQIIYDLRQFEMRFRDYKAAESKKENEREAGMQSLKQIWMDNVDIKRGNSSIKAMTFSQQGAFVTLLTAFMKVNSLEDVDKEDLNEIVKRVLKQRILEFGEWRKLSYNELYKRYKIQKTWLKSQVDSLKLYTRWAKPYLKAAEELRMSSSLSGDAALVKAFNTNVMQLVLFKKEPMKIQDMVWTKDLPPGFAKFEEKGIIRKYNACILADIKFRGIPTRVDQHYGFGGKSDVSFSAFALSDDEIRELKKRLDESDVKDALRLVQGATEDSLKEIEDDIRYFLEDVDERGEANKKFGKEEEEAEEQDINPFSALIGFGSLWGERKEKKGSKKSTLDKKENYAEKVVRKKALSSAKKNCFTVYDIYKKSHGMASVPIDIAWDSGFNG